MTHHALTFLFTDLEDSTRLWEQFPDAMRPALARHDELMKHAVKSHHGRIVKTTGDGLHAVFESASDGVAAALAAQQAIIAESWPEPTGRLQVRMGLHTGESQEREGDFYGSEVNRAARLMGLAYGGQILISELTAALIRNALPAHVSLADLGEHRLKGLAAPERIFQIRHPTLRAEFPPLKSLAAFKHNLPLQRTSFIGREKELADVKRLLTRTRLLTLLGPGGTGKTRLGLHAAADLIDAFADGVWFVELAALADPDLLPDQIANTLRIQQQPGRPLLDTLTDYLRLKELLLLLDNVEHLVRESAELVEHLLTHCPKIKLLVTGREALFIDGETTLQTPSLSLPKDFRSPGDIGSLAQSEAVQLFVARAQSARPEFDLNAGNASTVAEIVVRLDGIPLALELAAARIRMLSVEQIAQRLNDRFRLLTGGRRTALPRQQTLQALIDWSWNLLDEKERTVLRRLSVFSGGWTLEAAQAIASDEQLDEGDVFDKLEQLINKSLVIVDHAPEGKVRYRMLESIRAYARDRLVEAGEGQTLRDRHAHYFAALADGFDLLRPGPEFLSWVKRFSLEADNIRAVLDWTNIATLDERAGIALRIAGTLLLYQSIWLTWLTPREARSRLEPAVANARRLLGQQAPDIRMTDFIRALIALGWLLVTHGDMTGGLPILDESIRLARELEEFRWLAVATAMKTQAVGTSVTPENIQEVEEVIAISRRNNRDFELSFSLYSAGQAHFLQGNFEKGEAYFTEVIRIAARLDDPRINAMVFNAQALMARAAGNSGDAEKYYLLALELAEKLGDQRMVASGRSELGHMYRQEGKLKEAEACYRQTILAWQEQGHPSAVAHQLECFAYLAIARGHHEHAARLLGAAEKARERLSALSTDPREIAELEQAMSRLGEAMGEAGRAKVMAEGKLMSLDDAVLLALEETP